MREFEGTAYYFCCEGCASAFDASHPASGGELPSEVKDPICGMTVTPDAATPMRMRDGKAFYFCCEGCARMFEEQTKPVVHDHS